MKQEKTKWFTLTDVFDSRVLRISLIVTVVFSIWHATLIHSGIPYINNVWSWITTLIGPVLFIASIKMIYRLYVGYPGGELGGGLFGIFSEGIGWIEGEAFLALIGILIAIVLLVILLPIVGFLLPAEVFIGFTYKSQWWNLISETVKESTLKENIFLFIKGLMVNFTISFIIWEIIVNFIQAVIRLGKWAWDGEKIID